MNPYILSEKSCKANYLPLKYYYYFFSALFYDIKNNIKKKIIPRSIETVIYTMIYWVNIRLPTTYVEFLH